jgi:iron complex outermembrane recepter protein
VKAFMHTSGERQFVRKAGATAVSLAVLAMASSVAYAQQAADPAKKADEPVKLETLEVTGIRKGIESAISVKKNSDNIVESVSAEDIGKLPDSSIAESIARLPGLAAQRVAGRAQVISVRGLSPDFATTLLNGREQVSTGDNRSVEFDQYPSELLSGVTVYKTPDASLIGQGLSGTLDMQTVRPLSFANRTLSANLRGEHNSLGSTANASANGNRFSVSYIDQFMNRTFGVALGFAHLDSPVLENQVGVYEPWKVEGRPGVPTGTLVTDGIKSLARSGKNSRDGFMAVLEYKPSKQWTSMLDLYTSKFKRTDTANQFEVNLGGYNGGFPPGLNFTNATVNASGVLTGGTATGVYPLVRGMYNDRKDTISALGWNNKFQFGAMSVTADLNYSKAKRDELSLETNTQLRRFSATSAPLDAVTLNWNTGSFPTIKPGFDYSDPSKLFLDSTIYGSGYGKTPRVEDELKGFKLTGLIPLGGLAGTFSELDLGINYAERTKKKRQPEGNINLGAQGPTTISSDLLYSPVDLGFSGTGIIPSWNVPAVVAKYMTFAPSETLNYLIPKAWDVNEKITTGYAKLGIDRDLGAVSLRGNFGVQLQNTDQSSNSNYFDGGAPKGQEVKPVSDGKTYTDVLPSLNLVFGLANDQTVRFAAAKQVARPRVDQLRAGLDFGVDKTTFKPGGSGGNPRLDPWRATALDLSYEKYFGTKAYVAVAGFYKNMSSYIYEQSREYDFSKFTPGTIAATNIGQYKAPYNGKGGKLQGAELSVSLPFNMITPALDGFGLTASASFTDSKIKIQDPNSNAGSDIPLPGLSKTVTNLTAYYEKYGFSTRVSQRKRSDFVGEISNFSNDRTLRYVVGENVVDAQVGYNFESGALKGLGLLLQVNNLTNSPYQTYAVTKDRPYEYIKYGRTYLFGLSYKL